MDESIEHKTMGRDEAWVAEDNSFMEDFSWATQWVEYMEHGLEIEPNSLYHFVPNATYTEFKNFIKNISYKQNELKRELKDINHFNGPGVKYFYTDEHVEFGGWCDLTNPNECLGRPRHYVNVRELYGYTLK